MTSPQRTHTDRKPLPAGLRAVLSPASQGNVILSLSGGLDTTTTEILHDTAARCLRDEPAALTIDLRDLSFCDSAGVRALRWVAGRSRLAGTRCRIANPQPQVCRLLILAAVDLLDVLDAPPTTVPSPAQ